MENDMNKHFAYLVDDDDNEFLQKLACSEAQETIEVSATAPQQEVEKVASVNQMQKVAARVELDIEIIKTAGHSGFNFGTINRSLDYIDGLLYKDRLNEENVGDLFDKVAAAAIDHDMSIVHGHLLKLAGEEFRPWVDQVVREAGTDLVKAAAMDKEALFGLVRGAKAMHSAYKAVRGVGLGRGVAAKAALKAPAQSLKSYRTGAAVAKRGKAAQKLKRAYGKAELARGAQSAKVRAAKGIKDTAVRKSVLPGVEAKAKAVGAKQGAKVQKAQANLAGREAKLKQRQAIEAGRKPGETVAAKAQKQTAEASKTKSLAAEGGRSQAAGKASEAAKTRSLKKPDAGATTAMSAADKEKAIARGGDKLEGAQATMGSSLASLKDKGWSKLTPDERTKVLQAGAGAYIAKETLLS
jgi:hypothetical protein